MPAAHFKTLTLALSLSFLPLLARAQAPGSCTVDSNAAHKNPTTLAGAITDPTGAAIVAATLVLICKDPVQETHTAADGYYSLSVAPGTYELKITTPNFQSETRTIHLSAKRKTLDVTLALGRATSIVSVTAPPRFCRRFLYHRH